MSYLNCNSSVNKYQKEQNPSFGKLLLDDNISLDILQAIAKNNELKHLVKKFHGIGLNVKAFEGGLSNSCDVVESLHLYTYNGGNIQKNIKTFIRSVRSNGNSSFPVSVQLERLEPGFAEETFNKYLMDNSKEIKKAKLTKEALSSIDSFNNSLEKTKKNSFKRFLDFFNN